jgi:Tol biopolymer transport system component
MIRTRQLTTTLLAAALLAGLARAQTTQILSLAPGGTIGDQASLNPRITPDGRFVTYHSAASNLVPGDTNLIYDVFVHDRLTTATERVSVSSTGAQADSLSTHAVIASSGRFVAFNSLANNLVPSDTGGFWDVFVRDRMSATTERVSVTVTGQGGSGDSGDAFESSPTSVHTRTIGISADGRFVMFTSAAPDLVPADSNQHLDVFVRDRQAGVTERVSVATGGVEADGPSVGEAISADGRCVLLSSHATNLVAGDTNGALDLFVHDRQTGTTALVVQGNAPIESGSISGDGRFVAFVSAASDFVPGDTNGMMDAFVHDRQTGATERVSVDTNGAEGDGPVTGPAFVETGGRFVTFPSFASNHVLGDTNATIDIFLRDRSTGTTSRVSVATGGGEGNSSCEFPSVSNDGRFVAFHTFATNLAPGDTNGWPDVVLHDSGTPALPSAFCFGDGSGTACPCGNVGATWHGCGNSANASGAALFGYGTASIGADTFVLSASGMPNAAALYFQGTTQLAGGAGVVLGDGLRCAGGTIRRLGTKLNFAGSSQYPIGADAPVSVRGMVTSPGIRTYQIWYRNAAAYCTSATHNLSNGLEVQWSP